MHPKLKVGAWTSKRATAPIKLVPSFAIAIGVPDDIAAGGRARICPESAISKPEWKGWEATFGPQI